MSEHLLEMAKALVRVKDGKVEVLTEPGIRCCPLRRDLYGIQEESRETVQRVLEGHMKELGMYGPERVLELQEEPVSFGASEILADAMREELVDAAVVVCDGAGTVVATRPEVLQAIGAHMTGLVKTEPKKEIQKGLVEKGCTLLDRQGTMDQVKGFEQAALLGFKKIAVTVAGSRAVDAEALRKRDLELGTHSIILAVHTTGISESEALALAELRPRLVLRLTCCPRGGGKESQDADRHLHSRLRPHPRGKEADLEPGAALFRAAGPAPDGAAAGTGGQAAGASDIEEQIASRGI